MIEKGSTQTEDVGEKEEKDNKVDCIIRIT